jgi:ESCRT-I complex subunit VPS28
MSSYVQHQMSSGMLPPPPSYGAAVAFPSSSGGIAPSQPGVPSAAPPNRTRSRPNEIIKLYNSAQDRALYDELSDLYSIIRATEAMEVAYGRDAITTSEYGEQCTKLISQFKGTESGLIKGQKIRNIDEFWQEYGIDCPRAYERLVKAGVPATVMHATFDERQESVLVAETVQYFITAMDGLKLDLRAVDNVQPLIADVMTALRKIKGLPVDFEGLLKLQTWLENLNNKRAADNIDEEDARQLIFDLENSYSAFLSHLSKGRTK